MKQTQDRSRQQDASGRGGNARPRAPFFIILTLLVSASHAQAPRIAVFVTAHTNEQGFIEPGVPDSVRDIQREIPKRRRG